MSKAFNICQEAVDKFGADEATAHFTCTVRKMAPVLMDEDGSTVRGRTRAIAKLKNSLTIFVLANKDAVIKQYVEPGRYERFAPSWEDVIGPLEGAVETMPKRKGRGFNARLSMALGGLLFCIGKAERELVAYSPNRKKAVSNEQWNDLLSIKRNIDSKQRILCSED